MEVSFGLFIILVLIVIPGLILRRFYFYGEFSKQFNSGHNLISLIAISAIPGMLNLILIYVFYDNLITSIDLGVIIDKLKEINSPEFRLSKTPGTPLSILIKDEVAPFIGFLYLSSFILGILTGRLIRISRIDTKFKLLRFKNYWFYLFNGQNANFKKMKFLKAKNKKHLFTKADILIDSNHKIQLYSGIVVDYELQGNDYRALSKVILKNAERYSVRDGKTKRVSIPGNLFVVDCSSMKNINLTYVYEETKNFLQSKLPGYIEQIFSVTSILLIPFFIFQSEKINLDFYQTYFTFNWFEKIISYMLVVQIIYLIKPFEKKDDEYRYVNLKIIIGKIVLIVVMLLLIWIF